MMNSKIELPTAHHSSFIDHQPPCSPCRLIVDPPAEGAWNMAIDEALLDEAAESNVPTLRFYQWQRPTLSLGYFQSYADRNKHPSSLEVDVVRRLSGGGAILHDQEVTYSLMLPRSHPAAQDTQELYRAVHKAIIRLLSRVLSSKKSSCRLMSCEAQPRSEPESEPFLCFQRRSQGDVLLLPADTTDTQVDYKIVGSAQRRRRGAVMQHGSLLLRQSPDAPELLGLNEVVGSDLSPENVLESLPAEIGSQLGMGLQQISQTPWHQAAKRLVESRYASTSWSRRR